MKFVSLILLFLAPFIAVVAAKKNSFGRLKSLFYTIPNFIISLLAKAAKAGVCAIECPRNSVTDLVNCRCIPKNLV